MVTGVIYECPKCRRATRGCMLDKPCIHCNIENQNTCKHDFGNEELKICKKCDYWAWTSPYNSKEKRTK